MNGCSTALSAWIVCIRSCPAHWWSISSRVTSPSSWCRAVHLKSPAPIFDSSARLSFRSRSNSPASSTGVGLTPPVRFSCPGLNAGKSSCAAGNRHVRGTPISRCRRYDVNSRMPTTRPAQVPCGRAPAADSKPTGSTVAGSSRAREDQTDQRYHDFLPGIPGLRPCRPP